MSLDSSMSLGGSAVTRCTIAVLTYLRPADLAALIPLLLEQAERVLPTVTILIVDNDPSGGAYALASSYSSSAVVYLHEPSPGIAAARNSALNAARNADVLVFIDDDERPSDRWLAGLLATYTETRPAAVVGRVVSKLAVDLDPWILAGRFFDRRTLPTGTAVSVAATNNLLLDLAVVQRLDLRFDEAFGMSGGSDTLFTRALSAAGETMLWNDEAVVVDVVPTHRQTRNWVLQRAYRSGNSWSQTAIALDRRLNGPVRTARGMPRPRRAVRAIALRFALTGRGSVRVLAGAARTAFGWVTRSVSHDARGHRTLARGAGMVTGAWGHQYLEYRRNEA